MASGQRKQSVLILFLILVLPAVKATDVKEQRLVSALKTILASVDEEECDFGRPECISAGGDLCLESCGRRGYAYSWCYLVNPVYKKWDYCCEDQCSLGSCSAGSVTASCSSYDYSVEGWHTVDGDRCLCNYPCGKHRWDSCSNWCYIRGGGWGHCCMPDGASEPMMRCATSTAGDGCKTSRPNVMPDRD